MEEGKMDGTILLWVCLCLKCVSFLFININDVTFVLVIIRMVVAWIAQIKSTQNKSNLQDFRALETRFK